MAVHCGGQKGFQDSRDTSGKFTFQKRIKEWETVHPCCRSQAVKQYQDVFSRDDDDDDDSWPLFSPPTWSSLHKSKERFKTWTARGLFRKESCLHCCSAAGRTIGSSSCTMAPWKLGGAQQAVNLVADDSSSSCHPRQRK